MDISNINPAEIVRVVYRKAVEGEPAVSLYVDIEEGQDIDYCLVNEGPPIRTFDDEGCTYTYEKNEKMGASITAEMGDDLVKTSVKDGTVTREIVINEEISNRIRDIRKTDAAAGKMLETLKEKGFRIMMDDCTGNTYAIIDKRMFKLGCSTVFRTLERNECLDENGTIVKCDGTFAWRCAPGMIISLIDDVKSILSRM